MENPKKHKLRYTNHVLNTCIDVSNRTCQYICSININWPDDYYQSIKLIMQDNTDDINSNIQIQAVYT